MYLFEERKFRLAAAIIKSGRVPRDIAMQDWSSSHDKGNECYHEMVSALSNQYGTDIFRILDHQCDECHAIESRFCKDDEAMEEVPDAPDAHEVVQVEEEAPDAPDADKVEEEVPKEAEEITGVPDAPEVVNVKVADAPAADAWSQTEVEEDIDMK
jgi:hypothetical protein